MLVSGDQALISQLEPVLSKMTGKVLNFGPEAGRAAGMKLVGNAFLVETVFAWPGMARYGVDAILRKDLNAVVAVVMVFSDDPQMGLVSDRFTGSATATLEVTSFVLRTASLH